MNLKRFAIDDLRSFVTLAELLHFTHAAEQLGVGQPWLSRRIRSLEDRMGTALLSRTNRRIQLTDAGRVLRDEAGAVLFQMEELVRRTRLAAEGKYGRLRVGFVSGALTNLLPSHLRRFSTVHPEVQVDVRHLQTAPQLRALVEDQLDIGYVRADKARGVSLRRVGMETFRVALPKGHPLTAGKKVSLRKLAGEPFLFVRRDLSPDVHDHYMSILRRAGVIPHIAQWIEDTATLLALVGGGMGCSIVLSGVAASTIGSNVELRPIENDRSSMPISLAWRSSASRAVVTRYIEIMTSRKSGRLADMHE